MVEQQVILFALFTGIFRTLNDKHWVGDVVAGAGIGILTEAAYWLFPKVSKIFSKNESGNTVHLFILIIKVKHWV